MRTAGKVIVDKIIKTPAIKIQAEGIINKSFYLQVDFAIIYE